MKVFGKVILSAEGARSYYADVVREFASKTTKAALVKMCAIEHRLIESGFLSPDEAEEIEKGVLSGKDVG